MKDQFSEADLKKLDQDIEEIKKIEDQVTELTAQMGTENSGAQSANAETSVFPSFQAKDLDGNKVDSSIFSQNAVTVVNFWFNGCTPCVEELPALWNQKMQEYLQITPADDAEGILQDMHWSDGSFGYFPSYLLGSIYDGMYLDRLEEELGSVDALLAEGRISEITKWLNEKIHQYGSTRSPKEVIRYVCGKEVSAEPLIRYFKEKYTKGYNLG